MTAVNPRTRGGAQSDGTGSGPNPKHPPAKTPRARAVPTARPKRSTTPMEGTHGVVAELAELLVPIDQTLPYPDNARTHDAEMIRASLVANGQYKALTGQLATRFILVGNGTREAALSLGWTHLAVQWVDVDDALARRINLVDNHASDFGGYVEDNLLHLLELAAAVDPSLVGTGYTGDEVDAIRALAAGSSYLDSPEYLSGVAGRVAAAHRTILIRDVPEDLWKAWNTLEGETPTDRLYEALREYV